MGSRCAGEKVVCEEGRTYSYFTGHKIYLVQYKNEMFVRRFCADVFFNTATSCSIGITRIQNVENDIGRVDDFVKLVPDAFTGTLHENELDGG
jgi:hypothetical protein